MPLAVDTTGLVATCRVSAGGSSWECVDSAGASFGTVTQGTGTTYQNTNLGPRAMSDVTSAKAPHLVSATLDTLWKGDHTVVMAGYGTTQTDATFQHWFGFSDGTNTVFARNDSGTFKCAWTGSGGSATASNGTTAVVDGWAVTSCRASGNDHYARVNGTDSVVATHATISGNVTVGTGYYMGDRQSAGLPLRGPYAWVAFYNVAKTDAQLKVIERSWWGGDTRVGGGGLATATYCLDTDGGQVDCYFSGANMVGPLGLRTVRGTTATNKWAADSLLATSGTDVGSPTITAGVGPGPFFRLRNKNVEAQILDDDASAFEGKQGASGYVGNGYYTTSFYLSAGDAGTVVTKARLKIDVTGGGWDDAGTTYACDVTGLTYAGSRYSCQSPFFYADAGSPTVKSSILVGNAVSDTGSINVSQRQLTAAGWATVPIIDNTARGNSAQTIDPVTDAWPTTTNGGKYEIVFTPVYSAASDSWDEQTDTIYLFDSHDATPEHGVVTLFGYNTAGRAMARTENGGSQTEFIEDGVSLTPYSLYAVSMEWLPVAGGCSVVWRFNSCSGSVSGCHATTAHGSTSSGVCPAQPTAVNLANRLDGTVPTDVNIAAVRIYSAAH